MDNVSLYPEWKQAVEDFLAEGINDGEILTHAWLEARFGMKPLGEDDALTSFEFQGRQFLWLRNLDAFRDELLESHRIFLASVPGKGYRVVPAREQTAVTQEKFEREAKKAYRRAANTLRHVRVEQLSEAQRKENSDAIAKLAMLRGMQKAIE